ncbi:MAG: DUF1501 domain-containing protein [Bacteroidota bacterium]
MGKEMSRRNFLGKASCAALGSVSLLSGLFNLQTSALLASNAHRMSLRPTGDYKALVCILLAGGNDSFNMLVPTADQAYQDYRTTRSNLALDKASVLPITPNIAVDGTFGLHPSMPEVQQLFQQGDLTFLSNVGTLVEQVSNRQQFLTGAAKLPVGLFSHADQIQQWQTSIPQTRSARGWGGRLADLLNAANSSQDISMNISLSGNNVFQAGNQVVEYAISPFGTGSAGINEYGDSDPYNQIRTAAVKSLLEQQYQDIFKQTYADITRNAQSSHEKFSAAVGQVNLTTEFSANYLSQSMQMIARTIAARESLGMSRQTFFVTYGGWDHHDELLNNQAGMLSVVSKALGEFQTAMKELAVEDDVTTFTISDFARTLTSNGNGTDHAWGGNTMIMGGAVKGGNLFGTYPSLALNNDLDVGEGNGILIPTTSTDAYFAELALWLGVAPSDLSLVLPNIGTHFDPTSGSAPIGFLL